jgi:hypothetical protein
MKCKNGQINGKFMLLQVVESLTFLFATINIIIMNLNNFFDPLKG